MDKLLSTDNLQALTHQKILGKKCYYIIISCIDKMHANQ